MFGWREAYTTLSMNDFAKARDGLSPHGIRFRVKYKNMLGSGQRTDTLGVNTKYAIQYYIFVKKDDLEQAQNIINKALHG